MEDKKKEIKNMPTGLPLGYAFMAFFLVFVLAFTVLFYIESQVREARVAQVQDQETRIVALETDFLSSTFSRILSDLHYLHHAYEEDIRATRNYEGINQNWTEFASQRKVYDQIRYIDKSGQEKIRINKGDKEAYAVEDKDLQNKKDRYYFTRSLTLSNEEVYVSPLDLNVEEGRVEEPYKPMIRFSTPIVGPDGQPGHRPGPGL